MFILGINAYHADSSAAIFKDGVLIAATEEERFRRVKHWAGFPALAIEFCLKETGILISCYLLVIDFEDLALAGRLRASRRGTRAWFSTSSRGRVTRMRPCSRARDCRKLRALGSRGRNALHLWKVQIGGHITKADLYPKDKTFLNRPVR